MASVTTLMTALLASSPFFSHSAFTRLGPTRKATILPTTSRRKATPMIGPHEIAIPPLPFFCTLPADFGGTRFPGMAGAALAAPPAGIANVVPQVGHLPFLPAHSSFTFRFFPHPPHVTEIGMIVV